MNMQKKNNTKETVKRGALSIAQRYVESFKTNKKTRIATLAFVVGSCIYSWFLAPGDEVVDTQPPTEVVAPKEEPEVKEEVKEEVVEELNLSDYYTRAQLAQMVKDGEVIENINAYAKNVNAEFNEEDNYFAIVLYPTDTLSYSQELLDKCNTIRDYFLNYFNDKSVDVGVVVQVSGGSIQEYPIMNIDVAGNVTQGLFNNQTPEEKAEQNMVYWVESGSKYHKRSSCSSMDNPIKGTKEESNRTACQRCF